MRAWMVALTFIACGSPAPAPEDMSVADATIVFDLTPPVRRKIGCKDYVQCLLDCGNDTVCSDMCNKDLSLIGRSYFNKAIACGQNWCLGTDDMGSGACIVEGTMLKDPPGKTGCSACLNNALAAFFGQTCDPPNDPNCNPPSCADENQTCLNHL
jgi:hypothetical protein